MEGWCRLCFGRFHDKLKSSVDSDDAEDQTVKVELNESESSKSFTANLPLLSIISIIDQVNIVTHFFISFLLLTQVLGKCCKIYNYEIKYIKYIKLKVVKLK